MYIITLGVADKKIHLIKKEQLNSGSLNVDKIRFNFSGEEWNLVPNRVATFIKQNGEKYNVVLTPNNEAIIPKEVYSADEDVAIGVYGYKIEDNRVVEILPSNLITQKIVRGAYEEGMEPGDLPTPTQWEMYIQEINEIITQIRGSIPTKTSQLENDSGFVTNVDINLKLQKVEDYLYKAYYNTIDYDFAYKFFKEQIVEIPSGCTAIRKGNFIGRNLDWIYNEKVEFVVNIPRVEGRYASIGMGSGTDKLTKELVESGEYSELYKIVPFITLDGINEYGVFMNTNVVPQDKGITTGTTPLDTPEIEIATLMLPRFVLDHFKSANDAVNYIQNHVSIYATKSLRQMGYETHFMLGDSEKTYLLEVRENVLYVTDMTENSNSSLAAKSYMTNFYLSDIVLNEDGKVYTPEYRNGNLNAETYNLISEHGQGLERYNLIVENFEELNERTAIKDLMTNLFYTNTYKSATNPFWYSEFAEGSLTVISEPNDFNEIVSQTQIAYENRSKNPESPYYGTWHTIHSSIYDIENRKLYVRVQEGTDEHEYDLEYYYTSKEIDDLLSRKQNIEDNNLQTNNKEIVPAINEINSMTKSLIKSTTISSDSTNDTIATSKAVYDFVMSLLN